MADMTPLATAEQYAALLARMNAQINALAQMFIGDAPVNIPAGVFPVRFNTATQIWEEWDGAAWQPLAAKYGITVDKADNLKDSGGTYRVANTGAVSLTIPVRDATGKLPGSITGDAATVDGKNASDFATASQGTKADAALPSASYTAADVLAKIKTVDGSGSGLDADTVDGIQGAALITTSNIGSQSVGYATSAGNAATANNATTAAGKQIDSNPTANAIPVRGASLFLNEIYSATFTGLSASGITITGLSLQQYGVVDIYITAKLTQAVSDWFHIEMNGDGNSNNYLHVTDPVNMGTDNLSAIIGTVSGATVNGFTHIRLYLGSGAHCYGQSISNCSLGAWDYSEGGPLTKSHFSWKSTANVTQLRFFVRNSKVIANGAKVVICRAA